ncbi:MAG: hypothetical protein H6621_11595 [Halobacteriovoraceae bacterium]|nr:hypothetical protein [Halobacteriovoraceae bacterium]MCB9095703.1 hypothetical protein [Halobacteriovoraceae bacterium]
MNLFLLTLFLFSFQIFAETDLQEQLAKHDLKKFLESNFLDDQKIDPNTKMINCASTEPRNESEIICLDAGVDIDPENYSIFQMHYGDAQDLPSAIKYALPGDLFDYSPQGFSLVIAVPNDDKLMGLWGVMFDKDGDDYGETSGLSIQLKKTFKNDMTFTLEGSTQLYTLKTGVHNHISRKKKNGKYDIDNVYEQLFTNENIIKLVVDNIQQGNALYYKVGLGWINLDSKHWKSPFLASGQQKRWHNLIDSYNFDYKYDTKKVQNGLNVEAFIGLQKNLVNPSSTCRLRVYGEMGGVLNDVDASSFKTEIGSTFYIEAIPQTLSYKMGLSGEALVHETGVQSKLMGTVGIQHKNKVLELEYNQKFGKLQNHVNYNRVNRVTGNIDPIMTVRMRFYFGQWKPQ